MWKKCFTIAPFPEMMKRAEREYNQGNYAKAEEACLKAYQQEPRNTAVLLLLSSVYFQLRQYDKSADYSDQAIAVNKNLAEVKSNKSRNL